MFGLIFTIYFMTMDNPSTLSAEITFYIQTVVMMSAQS